MLFFQNPKFYHFVSLKHLLFANLHLTLLPVILELEQTHVVRFIQIAYTWIFNLLYLIFILQQSLYLLFPEININYIAFFKMIYFYLLLLLVALPWKILRFPVVFSPEYCFHNYRCWSFSIRAAPVHGCAVNQQQIFNTKLGHMFLYLLKNHNHAKKLIYL